MKTALKWAAGIFVGLLVLGGIVSAISGGEVETTTQPPATTAPAPTPTKATTEATETAEPEPAEPTETVKPEPAEERLSAERQNALRSAQQYIETMAMAKEGLIDQLKFEGYSEADATYAAEHVEADWNAEAAEAAEEYLDLMPMSRAALVDQLEFHGFTPEQVASGADKALQ